MKYYFETVSEIFGKPNEQLGFGVCNTECYVPLNGSICFEAGNELVYIEDIFYELPQLIFPISESHIVTEDNKYYDTLMNGFGI